MSDRRVAGTTGASATPELPEGSGGSAHCTHWVDGNWEQCCECDAVFPTVQAAMESDCPQPTCDRCASPMTTYDADGGYCDAHVPGRVSS